MSFYLLPVQKLQSVFRRTEFHFAASMQSLEENLKKHDIAYLVWALKLQWHVWHE